MKTQTNDTTTTRPAFGQRVRIKAKAVRWSMYDKVIPPEKSDIADLRWNTSSGYKRWKFWSRWPLKAPVEGLYIGWRVLQDGYTRWEDEEVGTVFNRVRDLRAWLVVLDEHRAPVLVFPEDVEVLDIDAEKTASVTRGGRT